MIFATIGTQLPFDRLVMALDRWAESNPATEVVAQVGHGAYEPGHVRWVRAMDPAGFRDQMARCDTVVAHAGMGTIISAIELGKRVIVMPRRASLGEHRNEHQLATTAHLDHLDGLQVVHDASSLAIALDGCDATSDRAVVNEPHPSLISAIRRFAGLPAQ